MRTSIYKDKVIAVLTDAHLLSIGDIQKSIKDADFSTIFRNVEQLCTEGLVSKVVISKDVVLYELVNQDHQHDHFVCNDCGVVESVQLSKKFPLTGKAIATDVLIRGKCNECVK